MKTGGCDCGAVRWSASGEATPVTVCHCSRCRRWHGHVGAYAAVDRAGFSLTESRGLRWYVISPVRRGFCGERGSSVLGDEAPDARTSICAGSFDAPTGLRPKAHISLGSKGDSCDVPDDGLLRRQELKT